MSDAVAIVPDLAFRQQIADTLQYASRSLAAPEAARELLSQYDAAAKTDDSEALHQDTVRKVVATYVEAKGALEAAKEGEAESSHLLLQHVIATNFDVKGDEYPTLVKSVLEAVRVGGEAAAQDGRSAKLEAASRILNNTYNYLAPESALRPAALLALIQVLGASDDVSTLPLSASTVRAALAQWAISDADKVAFLASAAAVYERAGDLATALSLTLLSLERQLVAATAEHALALALAQPNRFELDDLLKVQGARDSLTGKAAELVSLFGETDELEAVAKATTWAAANAAYVSGLNIAGLDVDAVLRKVRLIALTTLAARSATKQIPYADVAAALAVDEADVEAWVIDAIHAKLLSARLSQPLSVVRIISVSSHGTRRFGSDEWQLLERRLSEWKSAVSDARQVVDDAENLAAQGPITHQRRQPKEQNQRRGGQQGQEQQQQSQQQQQQEQEVAA